MSITIRELQKTDLQQAITIWNAVVEGGLAFPQMECLTKDSGLAFFSSQTFTGVAYSCEKDEIVGVYILHPNNVGRCGHICNASYAVKEGMRGKHIGEKLVKHSLFQGEKCGFKILQFNAVVASNAAALHLYQKLGFVQLGKIPNGFLRKDGCYEDIIPHYIEL